MKYLLACILLACSCVASFAQTAQEKVVGTELAFAERAKTVSLKDAYMTYTADSGLVYGNGGLVLTKNYYKTAPKRKGQLTWFPEFVTLSQAGDLAFSCGPWFYKENSKVKAQGHFNTVWKLYPDGNYRFLIDLGVDYPLCAMEEPDRVTSSVIKSVPSTLNTAAALEMDLLFAKAARRKGKDAYLEYMSEEVRIMRPGHTPLIDKNRITPFLAKEPKYEFEPVNGYMAQGGDMAYVYGTVASKNKKGGYFRIWKNEERNGWKVVLEVMELEGE